jgi:hypothetical protein
MTFFFSTNYFNLPIFFVFGIFFAFSMYGWSQIFILRTITKFVSLNIVIGMGFTLFLGGILNHLKLANDDIIKIIFLLGLFLFFLKLYKVNHYFNLKILIKNINKINFILLIPTILLILSIAFSVNPHAYNYHDDFQKYFLHPVKMLETGSIFGSTLSAIGSETIGGQSFFQSFFISWLGLRAINIFDSVFCLSLCLFVILEWSTKKRILNFGVLIASLLLLINQQYVNVTSIYSGVLFMFASIIFSLEILKEHSTLNSFNLKIILAMSFCFGSLFVLKPTYILFSIVYFTSIMFFLLFFFKLKKNLFFFSVFTPLLSFLIALPWSIFTIKNYIDVRQSNNENFFLNLEIFKFNFPSLISTKPLFYGGTQFHYTMLIFFGILFVILTVYLILKKKVEFQTYDRGTIISSSSSLISVLIIYLILMILSGLDYFPLSSSIRYSIPFIIALVPVGILILYSLIPFSMKYFRIFICTYIIFFSIAFFPQYIKNIYQSYTCGSKLSFTSFACSKKYIAYNKNVFSKNKKLLVRQWQENIPAGQAVMVWVNTPFYLNFKRNEIIEIDIVGLDNSWAIFPSAKYMIWEYNSFATRSLKALYYSAKNDSYYDRKNAIKTINFIKRINELFKSNKIRIIKDDGSTIIFKID